MKSKYEIIIELENRNIEITEEIYKLICEKEKNSEEIENLKNKKLLGG